jgi:hypothetical protein
MKQLIKYGRLILGVFFLLALVFPHTFLPEGVSCAFALAVFTQTCAKNTAGCSRIWIAEKSAATAFTVQSGEITAVTGTTPFKRVDAIQDSISWEEKVERVGLNNHKVTNTIEFDVMPPAVATSTFLQALIDASPCGLFAIIVDGNGKCWCVGHNLTDVRNRPLLLNSPDMKTGKNLSEAEGNTVRIQLGNECSGKALPFDSTLTTAILAAAADGIIDIA